MTDFGDLTEKNIGQLKVLNAAIFPVKYNEKFYADLLLPGREEFTKLAFYCDVLVGAVCCRKEEKEDSQNHAGSQNNTAGSSAQTNPAASSSAHNALPQGSVQNSGPVGSRMYMMTLGVLAPYRNLGIGSKLVEHAIKICSKQPGVTDIYLHVQVNNDVGIEFYKKFGFVIVDTIKNYYKKIDPPDCYVLQKKLHKP